MTDDNSAGQYGGYVGITSTATGFFRVERVNGSWWFITPDGFGFISVGLNHLDDTDLRYPYNFDVWQRRYGTRQRWIDAAVADLRSWSFNTLGWTRQWVSSHHHHDIDWLTPLNLGHGKEWSTDEVQRVGMPYVQQLTVAAIEGWNGNPRWPDVFSAEFDDHCAWLAREYCSRIADDPYLVGYFLTDIPAWLPHASGGNFAGLKDSAAQQDTHSLAAVADKYYSTISRHIRAYDANHLILGDRYNGNTGIPTEVLTAAAPHIDVLSVQYFTGNTASDFTAMRDHLANWSSQINLPVIVADIGNCVPTPLNPDRDCGLVDHADRGRHYVNAFDTVVAEPWLIGWHWCSYLENSARGWGLKGPDDEPYTDMTVPVAEFNRSVHQRKNKP